MEQLSGATQGGWAKCSGGYLCRVGIEQTVLSVVEHECLIPEKPWCSSPCEPVVIPHITSFQASFHSLRYFLNPQCYSVLRLQIGALRVYRPLIVCYAQYTHSQESPVCVCMYVLCWEKENEVCSDWSWPASLGGARHGWTKSCWVWHKKKVVRDTKNLINSQWRDDSRLSQCFFRFAQFWLFEVCLAALTVLKLCRTSTNNFGNFKRLTLHKVLTNNFVNASLELVT